MTSCIQGPEDKGACPPRTVASPHRLPTRCTAEREAVCMGSHYDFSPRTWAPPGYVPVYEAIPFTGSCAHHRRVQILLSLDPCTLWSGVSEGDAILHRRWRADVLREVNTFWVDADCAVSTWTIGRKVGYGPPAVLERAEKGLAAIAAFRRAVARADSGGAS
jgi:hypothetical protein